MEPLVYLLEDDASLRELIAEIVRDELCAQLQAYATISALQSQCASRRPDLIVADFWGASHLSLDDAERSEISAVAALAPVVLVSARHWAQDVSAAELGLVALVTKPLEIEGFVNVLRRALAPAPALGCP